MEERINRKLAYLYDMADKYNKLNKKHIINIYGDITEYVNTLMH